MVIQDKEDYYSILGVERSSSLFQITAAYKAAMKKHGPFPLTHAHVIAKVGFLNR